MPVCLVAPAAPAENGERCLGKGKTGSWEFQPIAVLDSVCIPFFLRVEYTLIFASLPSCELSLPLPLGWACNLAYRKTGVAWAFQQMVALVHGHLRGILEFVGFDPTLVMMIPQCSGKAWVWQGLPWTFLLLSQHLLQCHCGAPQDLTYETVSV